MHIKKKYIYQEDGRLAKDRDLPSNSTPLKAQCEKLPSQGTTS